MRMVIAGGGTGGHLFPGLALAEAVRERGGAVLLLGSGRRIEKMALGKTPYPVRFLPAEGVAGKSPVRKARALLKILLATQKAVGILRDFSPQVVFGVGGYASIPALLAAKLLGIKTAFHEQNALPGRANLFLSKIVDQIFVTFPSSVRYFPRQKVVLSGMPVRKEILKKHPRLHRGTGLLVTGGSQGAHFLNRLFMDLAPRLKEIPGLYLIHQTGEKDLSAVKETYRRWGVEAEVKPFIEEMGLAYAQADLVVCRAGASTVAEVCRLRKPAVFIPYPYAVRDHQAENARVLVQAGGALMFREKEIEPESFWETIKALLKDQARRHLMSQRLKGLLPENALEIILQKTEALAAHA